MVRVKDLLVLSQVLACVVLTSHSVPQRVIRSVSGRRFSARSFRSVVGVGIAFLPRVMGLEGGFLWKTL
jgi:hypothetical protein